MKKGFTLLEMLAVIVIITLITLMVATNLLNDVNNKRKDISETAKQMIYDVTDIYVKENSTSYPIEENAVYCIKLETLVNSGRLSNPVKDLKNDKEIPLNYYVKTTINEYNQYSYILVDNNSCTPAIPYFITDNNKYTKQKSITIKYPQSNYVKKYMVLSGTTKENITLNTEQTTTENPTITFTTNGSIKFWVEDNGVVVGEPTTVTVNKIDVTAPSVSLSKVTYKNIPFDSSWDLENSSIDSDGVLTVGLNNSFGSAVSTYIKVDGEFYYNIFDGYTDVASPNNCGEFGCIYWENKYFDENMNSTTIGSSTGPGHAVGLTLSEWNNNLIWLNSIEKWKSQKRYASNVQYIRVRFANSSVWSSSQFKVRNLKVYGEAIPNSFYLINITANDTESNIKNIKYAKGDKDSRYFENAGEKVEKNQIRVTSNGVYSVCVTDNAGNMKIQKITIDQIN